MTGSHRVGIHPKLLRWSLALETTFPLELREGESLEFTVEVEGLRLWSYPLFTPGSLVVVSGLYRQTWMVFCLD